MLDFYDFYRIHLNPTSELRNQYVGDCPFCDKEGHFFVHPESGMFDCKKCGTEGNHLTFITEYHKTHLEATNDGEYQSLAGSRNGITPEVLRRAGFAWDSINNRWLVPYQNGSEFLNNLGVFVPSQGFRIFKGPGLPLKLYRPFHTKTFTDDIVVCEGEWDLLALLPILEEMAPGYSICSVPGSNSFKDEYLSLFHNKNVYLLYDKDEAGKKGIAKAVRKLEGVASSIKFLKWDIEEEFNDANGESGGKDIRDYICHHQHQQSQSTSKRKPHLPNLIWTSLESNLVTPETDAQGGGGSYLDAKYTLPPVAQVQSWDELISTFRSNLYLTPGNEYAIATCFATILSPYFPGEPLWLFLIGPPSSGKTTIIESFGDSNIYCDAQSQISARMLVSGYKTPDGKDISYLPTLNGRTLMIKDFTTVLSMGGHEQEELYGILRDAFDGSFRKQYGNNQKRIYKDLKFGLIAGVTKAIHGDNRSSLGERFLKIEYLEKDEFCEMSHIQSALSGMSHKEERTKALMEHSLGYVDHLINNLPSELPQLNEQFTYKMSHLAMLVARLRAQVERRRDDSLLYRPEWEIASRLAVQFKKMSQCLMVVYGIKEPNNHLYHTIRKLALDSCIPFNVEFAKRMYEYPEGITRNDLSYHLQLPSTNVHRLLTDLQQLGLIQVSKSVQTGPGRKMELYHLTPEISKLWHVGIDTDLNNAEIPKESLPEKVELPRRKRVLRKPIDV